MKAYQMKITIKNSHPPIWRRFIVPAGLSFSQLSVVLNEVMGWSGYHLFSFEFYKRMIRIEEEDEFDNFDRFDDSLVLDAACTLIEDHLDSEDRFTYIYDFGDDWRHAVIVEKVIDNYEHNYPVVLKFKGDTPFEDCGGIYGYYNMLEILQDPSDPEYEEIKEWTDNRINKIFDIERVNDVLEKLALGNQKSKPMLQAQIYDACLSKGQGFKKIQVSKKRKAGSDSSQNETHAPVSHIDHALDDVAAFIEGMQGGARDMANSLLSDIRIEQEVSIRDILSDYTKQNLIDIARVHGLGGYSKLKKKQLVDFTVQSLLDKDVMCRYFTFLADDELEILKRYSGKELMFAPEEDVILAHDLYEGGYCAITDMDMIIVPKEVIQAAKINCDREWVKERRKALELFYYLNGAASLYGVCPIEKVLEIYRMYTGNRMDIFNVYSFSELIPHTRKNFICEGNKIIHGLLEADGLWKKIEQTQQNVPYYVPTKTEIETLGRDGYFPFDKYMEDLYEFLCEQCDEAPGDVYELCAVIQLGIRSGLHVEDVMILLDQYMYDDSLPVRKKAEKLITDVWYHTRMMCFRGGMPVNAPKGRVKAERSAKASAPSETGNNIVNFPVDVKKKIYPNDPCPCGSGKMYKMCCGRDKK